MNDDVASITATLSEDERTALASLACDVLKALPPVPGQFDAALRKRFARLASEL